MRRTRSLAPASTVAKHVRCLLPLAMLTACGGSQKPARLASQVAAPLPTYSVGDSYRFDDGTSDSVISVAGDLIRWQTRSGTYLTTRDVLLPPFAWTSGDATGERRFTIGPVALFPLEDGKGIKFTASRSVSQPGRQPVAVREDWRCDVAGAARVQTKAGDFDTWRVDCTMHESPPVNGNGVVRYNFYYATAVGYYVRAEEQIGDGPLQVAELTSFIAPGAPR